MTDTAKTDQAAARIKRWLIAHPSRAAAERFPIDECWTLLDERTADKVARDTAVQRERHLIQWGERGAHHRDGTCPERVWAFTGPASFVAQCAVDETRRLFAEGYGTWLDILREEVAEAFAESDPAALRSRLIRIAAVAQDWAADIDSRAQAEGQQEIPAEPASFASPEGWDDAWSRQQRAEADDPANWADGTPVHAEELDEHGRGTGHARCDTGDGSFVDGPIADSAWQVTCEKCLTGEAEPVATESGSAQ